MIGLASLVDDPRAALRYARRRSAAQARDRYHPIMANVLPVEIVGVSHVAGKYNFTDADFLNEGADVLHEMGCHIIKVWFTDLAKSYPFNSTWPKAKSLVEMAKISYFQKLFDKPIDTFILETYSPTASDH